MGNLIDRDDDLIRRGDAHTIEVKQGLFDDTFGLCRFGHHPDPAIDFCIEVEKLQSRLFDAKCCLSKPGTTPETVAAVLHDIKKAMDFRVGGDEGAVNAKHTLRALEADAIAALPAVTVGVKPLVWEDFGDWGAKASAYYQANYLIQFWKGREQFEVALSYPGYQTGFDGDRWHHTLDAAKAAAQADYEARILATLEPVTPAPLTAEEIMDIITKTEVADQTASGDRRWIARMAEALAAKQYAPQPAPDAAMRLETVSENIARDMREGRFPKRSEPQMVPAEPAPDAAIREAANAVLSASYHDERDAEVAHAAILALLENPHA